MVKNKTLKFVIILSLAGLILSSYLLLIKYNNNETFCNFSDQVSCDIVSQSPYSEFPANSGIPIAGLGIINYLLFLVPSLLLLKNPSLKILGFNKQKILKLMLVLAVFNIIFYSYLTYLELFVIYAVCPLCVLTFLISILILVALMLKKLKPKQGF